MKLAFSTVACGGLGYKEIVSCARSAGIEAVELRLDDENKILGLARDNTKELREYFIENKIKITNLGSSVNLLDYEPDKIKMAKECAELAVSVGAKGIRIFLAISSFVPYERNDCKYE